MRAYDSHQLKTIFDVGTLDLKKVALSFGFTVPPVVDLSKWFLIVLLFLYFDIFIQHLFISLLELGHKIRSRPEKRVGGGGYGRINEDDKNKARKFKNISGQNPKKFMR